MPITDDMQLISIDDHVVEPKHVWRSRLPKRFQEQGPVSQRVAAGESVSNLRQTAPSRQADQLEKDADVWVYNGRVYRSIGLNAVAGVLARHGGRTLSDMMR